MTSIAKCIGCGCDDNHACVDTSGTACHWLRVDKDKGIGVCSFCGEHLPTFAGANTCSISPPLITPIKRYFPDFHQSMAHQTSYMREAENGVYVDYAEYQRLEIAIQEARIQGIKYARNRLIAAYIHGWLDKPDSEVRDICRMLNGAASELKNEASDDWVSETFGDEWLETGEVAESKCCNAGESWCPDACPITGRNQQLTPGIILECMQDNWNEWCADTNSFPPDFSWRGGNGVLSFEASSWAVNVAKSIMKYVNVPVQEPTASELEGKK